VPRHWELFPGICLTTEENARKNLSQGSRRVPAGTMKTEYAERDMHNNKNKQLYRVQLTVMAVVQLLI